MDIARQAAPEIDRLVLSVGGETDRRHGVRLRDLGRELGLDTLELLPHLGDFLLAGRLTRDLAVLRVPYRPAESVLGRLDELEQKDLIDQGDLGLEATPAMRALLEELQSARAEVASRAWADHPEAVATTTSLAGELAEAASEEHVVAVVHRAVPDPADPFLLVDQRLVTLRYVRQHDHAEAWRSRGLTASEMVAMTLLWAGGRPDQGDGLDRLVESGLAEGDPPELTPAGRRMREEIEEETNERAEKTFEVLGDEAAARFLEALRTLPSAGD